MSSASEKSSPYRVGQWLPADQAVLEAWLAGLIDEVEREKKPLHPVVQRFKDLIERDSEIYMLFNQMFEQVPHKPPYNKDPAGKPQVRDYNHMLRLVNAIMTRAPAFNTTGVRIPCDGLLLDGDLAVPAGAHGLVVFAHGSGSSRHSSRN